MSAGDIMLGCIMFSHILGECYVEIYCPATSVYASLGAQGSEDFIFLSVGGKYARAHQYY